MKALVIGQGGREHALVKALSLSPSISEVHVIPGNPGMKEALRHQVATTDASTIVQLCEQLQIDFTVIGPEVEIAAGLSDELRQHDLAVVAPSCEAAQLESSKIYSKQFMSRWGVPTAKYEVVCSLEEVQQAAKQFEPPYILKADGLAAGKGVFICENLEELDRAAQSLFIDKSLGEAGTRALLEAHLDGWELSYLILTNGEQFEVLPLSQDHKRLKENDIGPNTGGMGVVAPVDIPSSLNEVIRQKIILPTVRGLKEDQLLYRGVLYVGIMVTQEGPSVLEYNIRFGDPEAQAILPLIESDLGQVFFKLSRGELMPLQMRPLHSCCVVMAAPGYPDSPQKGVVIAGDVMAASASSYFLHAGTHKDKLGRWTTNGGRVLNAIGIGSSRKEAIAHAYNQVEKICWQDMQFRKDIGAKLLF